METADVLYLNTSRHALESLIARNLYY